MPDRGVVRGGDSSIDSYIVPLSCIGQAEQHYYRGVIAMFLMFLDNITMHGRSGKNINNDTWNTSQLKCYIGINMCACRSHLLFIQKSNCIFQYCVSHVMPGMTTWLKWHEG